MRGLTLVFIFLLFYAFGQAQQADFASPLDIPLTLNGNFGELRANHFHTGIDLKTQGETGLPVYAAKEGYVSRIAVSATGYGNALYIDHPNGYTTLYGHLDAFSPEIAAWVKEQQYKQKSFEVNLFPGQNKFVVSQGEEIAKSGNSGGSAGPHLHFEIRETESEHPLNPLLFNFDIADKTKPVVENLYVYPLSDDGHVQNSKAKQNYKLVYFGNAYHLKGIQNLNVYGNIGFGIDAIDYLDGNWSKCGIYQMEYWVDNKLINAFELSELDFSLNRYINSHIDYEALLKDGRKVHKTFVEPGNKLKIYHEAANLGLFNFNDGKKHKVQILLYDSKMNASEISFIVTSTIPKPALKASSETTFNHNQENHFEAENVSINMPAGALYTNINFEFQEGKVPPGAFSPLYKIHSKYIPVHERYTVKIRSEALPKQLEQKAVIAAFDIQTGKFSSLGGSYDDGWVVATPRVFGNMCIAVDSIAPSIVSLSIKNNQLVESQKIRFKIIDDFSGIKKYTGTIDGKWILFEYDAKRDLLQYNFDDHLKKGSQHQLVLTVEDERGNINQFTSQFYY